MGRIFITLCLLGCLGQAGTAQAQITASDTSSVYKLAEIRELLEVTGSIGRAKDTMQRMADAFRKAQPQVPEKFWTDFMAEVHEDELSSLVEGVYDKNFTLEEVEAMLAFYRTPTGQSIITKMPQVTKESFEVGQEWGQALARRIVEKLKTEGYDSDDQP